MLAQRSKGLRFTRYKTNHTMQVNINSKANRTVIVKLLALSLIAITPALFIYVSYLLISL